MLAARTKEVPLEGCLWLGSNCTARSQFTQLSLLYVALFTESLACRQSKSTEEGAHLHSASTLDRPKQLGSRAGSVDPTIELSGFGSLKDSPQKTR